MFLEISVLNANSLDPDIRPGFLRRLILVCTVYQCPFNYATVGVNGLKLQNTAFQFGSDFLGIDGTIFTFHLSAPGLNAIIAAVKILFKVPSVSIE